MADVYIAETVYEVLEYVANKDAVILAGGTNVFVDRRKGKNTGDLISLYRIKELEYIKKTDTDWHIGSLTTFHSIEKFDNDDRCLSALQKAASLVGGPQIRNIGTIGGNIVSASPSADSVPVLMALDAKTVLLSKTGRHEVKIKDFMLGVNKVDIRKDEILTEIIIPLRRGKCTFYKVGKRNALAISIVNQAVYLEESDGKINKINIAIGSCAPKCVRAPNTENLLTGMYIKDIYKHEFKKDIQNAMDKDISPISDIRADADYRKAVAVNVLLENIRSLEAEK